MYILSTSYSSHSYRVSSLATYLLGTPPMPSSLPSNRHDRGRFLLVLAVVASLSTLATSQINVDCQSPVAVPPSPAPLPSSSSTTTTTNSTYWSNVVALLDVLPSAAAPTGFASLSRGTGTDIAFVRGICRGDSTPADCATYLRAATRGITSRCNSTSRRAGIWYNKCFVSYGDTNASTTRELQYRAILFNSKNVSNKDAFENTYYALMRRLTDRVINSSGTASSPAPMFATGEDVYDPTAPSGKKTMYGMLQCMRDRTAAECNRCLRDSIPKLLGCCYGHQGGTVRAYNCRLRVEIYTYYDIALDAPPPPPLPPLAPAPSNFVGDTTGKKGANVAVAVALPGGTVLVAVVILGVFLCRRNNKAERKKRQIVVVHGVFLCRRNNKAKRKKRQPDDNSEGPGIRYVEPEQLNVAILRAATNNFAEEKKLGEGGFGEVFKGVLEDGEEIAVKRLSHNSSQGFHELKNEVMLAAKLKHRNLVQLLGVCLQEEKLLVYEYMPNRSLDTFLFDPVRRRQLDWSRRFSIICGIARGLLYLHVESRLKVIHRDLKPSNVLLDADMNPKISDFGLARAFGRDQSRDVTRRPVGTLGYMSPEYAYCGHVSTKSDMFSFGAIVLEMVTGRRNNSSYNNSSDSFSVLSHHVWDKWKAGSMTDVVDPSLAKSQYTESEVLCCIEIGLLCVQEKPADRPDASAVVLMLSSPTATPNDRPLPSRPAFVFSSGLNTTRAGAWTSDVVPLAGDKQRSAASVSDNEVSISEIEPR
ncbi:unnamed protein product [Urochloa humidicola]